MYIFLQYHQILVAALCFFQAARSTPTLWGRLAKDGGAAPEPSGFKSNRFALTVFSSKGTEWGVNEMPGLKGRVAIVTGSNQGIGYVTALELARSGAKVYLACRSEQRATEAIEKIMKLVPNSRPQFLKLDISSLKSADLAAREFLRKEKRLDILVNNAGIGFTPFELSDDGIELQLCNAIGHFAFTVPLLDLLEKTSERRDSHVRIVNLSSVMHSKINVAPDFSSVDKLNAYSTSTWDMYGLSKLMAILFTNKLQERLAHTKIICTSVHPGGVDTNMVAGLTPNIPGVNQFVTFANTKTLLRPEDGAINTLYAATALEVEERNLKAAYLVPFGSVKEPSKLARDPAHAEAFWRLCEELVAKNVPKQEA